MSRRAQGLIACAGSWTVLFPGAAVAADGYDRVRATLDDRAMAPPRVIGTVRGNGLDLLILRDLHRDPRLASEQRRD